VQLLPRASRALLWFKLAMKWTGYVCSDIVEGQVEGKTEMTGRWWRIRKQLLYYLKNDRIL